MKSYSYGMQDVEQKEEDEEKKKRTITMNRSIGCTCGTALIGPVPSSTMTNSFLGQVLPYHTIPGRELDPGMPSTRS